MLYLTTVGLYSQNMHDGKVRDSLDMGTMHVASTLKQTRAYRLKKRACNCTPSKIQIVPKNSNSVYSEHWSLSS